MAAAAPTQLTASVNAAPSSADIAAALAEAKRRWAATGLDAQALAAMDRVSVSVANLDGLMLGQTLGNSIVIDVDGAGYGWFIDRTPGDDHEFTSGTAGLLAKHAPAAGRIDLLSVVTHELGHLAGLQHQDSGVMVDTLQAGQRTAPMAGQGAAHTAPAPAQPMSIDWRFIAQVRDDRTTGPQYGDLDWRQRFVNHLGAARDAINPNASWRVRLPVASPMGGGRVAR